MSEYNYADFDLPREMPSFNAFRGIDVRAGTRAPDFPLEDLGSGETVRLSDYWKRGHLLIEFGSFT